MNAAKLTGILLVSLLPLSAQQPLVDSRPIILAFGDSLTSGYGAPSGSSYPAILQRSLDAAGYSYRVVNMGRPGDTTAAGRGRMGTALLRHPAIVILEFGSNDRSGGITPARTRTNLEEMIQAFRDNGT